MERKVYKKILKNDFFENYKEVVEEKLISKRKLSF